MKIGFTGSRTGMTKEQRERVASLLVTAWRDGGRKFHHGDCLGADVEAHMLAREIGYFIVAHPPSNDRLRAFCEADITLPAKDYLPRNRDIVDGTDGMIATPNSEARKGRGGTWYTIGYAGALGRPLLVVWPDGRVNSEA